MKKTLIALIFCTLLSCSNNDSPPKEYTYQVDVSQTCPNGTDKTYTISKTTYEYLETQIIVNNPCQWVTFKDIHNLNQKGYIGSVVKYN